MVDWKKRIIIGLIAVPTLLYAATFKTSFLIIVQAASVFSLQEYTHIMNEILKKQVSSKYHFYITKLGSLQFIHIPILFFLQAVYFSETQSDLELYQFLTTMMISVCGLIKYLSVKQREIKEKDVEDKTLMLLTFGYITGYIFYFLIFVQPLSFSIYAYNYENGYQYVILYIITAFQSDNGALFMGSAIGKKLFCPRISPKKTQEGVLGALLLSVLTNVIIYFMHLSVMPDITLTQYIMIGVLGSIASIYGDLLESFIKRTADVKDSGSILPGHGGILDRLDSLMYSAPIIFMYIKIFILNGKSIVGA